MARKAKKKAKSGEKVQGAPNVSFEKQLAELEAIVDELESGDKSLDESLKLYEQGVSALKNCHAVLDAAEKRIKVLVEDAGGEVVLREAGAADNDQEDEEEEEDDDDGEDEDDGDEDDEESGEEDDDLF